MSAGDAPPRPRLLANECIEGAVVDGLRSLGYDIAEAWDWISVRGRNLDRDVLELGRELDRAVLTYDSDARSFDRFLDPGHGLIISRKTPPDLRLAAEYIHRSLDVIEVERISASIVVIEPGRIRIRDRRGVQESIEVRNL